ncbi:heparinase II/III-family protein [bacterium]|nr:heparinase II/III-family protein [bacterium]
MRNIFIVCTFLAAVMAGFPCAGHAGVILEPFTYTQDFETRELSAWASYPLWQDTAYDPNIRVNTIVPGDPNISLVQIVTPYSNVDNYAGAQKELDMYMTPGSSVSLRYYLKTNLPVKFFKIRIAAGADGKLDVTVPDPPSNRWERITVDYTDFIRENPCIAGKDRFKVNALAVLTQIPNADPVMPIYLGIDDVVVKGARELVFRFVDPKVFKLSEWKPYIARNHYRKGDTFSLAGEWPLEADTVTLDVTLFTDRSKKILSAPLTKNGNTWSLKPLKLSWPEGLYLGKLTASRNGGKQAETEFTLYIAPTVVGGAHPRLWFDAERKKWIDARLKSERFKNIYEDMIKSAKSSREKLPLDSIVFDIDQFPDENWLIGGGSDAWFSKIGTWESTIHDNALAYGLCSDREAGEYTKNLLVSISKFPYWLNPWMQKRGRNIYYPVGELGMEVALGYDLVYDLMDENERILVRSAMMKNIVLGCHKGYVEDDLVTSNTSNWVAHITGGSLMCQAAMYGDGPDVAMMEPYFTGAVMKDHQLIQYVLDKDGAYGEGWGYFNFSMLSWSKSLPAVENVFKVDMSGKLNRSYRELIWAGIVKDKRYFYFGDSSGGLGPLTNFAWLLPKYKDPLLSWFYNYLKRGETFMDVLYETADVPQDDPFDEKPVRLFREVGTTVFKSGWEPGDFVFVMRTGPFVNHQHLDQGSFWLSDRGNLFIEERHGSTYYEDPLYQPWYTQPVAHSTILIDHNHQSQRVGDTLHHVDGFSDYAYMTHFLDGEKAAFSSGNIGRLYWGKVKSIERNVLYLKPRTLLMLDTVVPADRDVDVTLLYQTAHLKDITPSKECSKIAKDSATLFIKHLTPSFMEVEAVETPHYLYTLLNDKPLEKEGMLTVTARTAGVPLVMANILTTEQGGEPDIATVPGKGCISGTANGTPFVFSTNPGSLYESGDLKTDALAVTYDGPAIFAAKCTTLARNGKCVLESEKPVTAEISASGMIYYSCCETKTAIGVASKPANVTVNALKTEFTYDPLRMVVTVTLPAGEGSVTVR